MRLLRQFRCLLRGWHYIYFMNPPDTPESHPEPHIWIGPGRRFCGDCGSDFGEGYPEEGDVLWDRQ